MKQSLTLKKEKSNDACISLTFVLFTPDKCLINLIVSDHSFILCMSGTSVVAFCSVMHNALKQQPNAANVEAKEQADGVGS